MTIDKVLVDDELDYALQNLSNDFESGLRYMDLAVIATYLTESNIGTAAIRTEHAAQSLKIDKSRVQDAFEKLADMSVLLRRDNGYAMDVATRVNLKRRTLTILSNEQTKGYLLDKALDLYKVMAEWVLDHTEQMVLPKESPFARRH